MSDLRTKPAKFFEELSTASLRDFCDGYRWMFERDFKSKFVSSETVAVAELKTKVEGIVAINNIAYAGETSGAGMFQIVLERDAVFSLGGVTVMLPIPRIKEDCLKGKEEDVLMLADAVGEVGNLLTGSFSKVFRAGVPDVEGLGDQFTMHLKLPIVIGDGEVPNLEGVQSVHVFTYQIELKELSPFRVKVVFPAQ